MGRTWTLMEAVNEFKQMAERKIATRGQAASYLLRTKAILDSLVPDDSTEIEEIYRRIKNGPHG